MAGWIIQKLGYGNWGLVDAEDSTKSPSVTASVAAPIYETFTRILQNQFKNDEEVRFERPVNYLNSFEYVAIAPKDTDVDTPLWNCVRCTWVNNRKTRFQYRENLSWSLRSIGW